MRSCTVFCFTMLIIPKLATLTFITKPRPFRCVFPLFPLILTWQWFNEGMVDGRSFVTTSKITAPLQIWHLNLCYAGWTVLKRLVLCSLSNDTMYPYVSFSTCFSLPSLMLCYQPQSLFLLTPSPSPFLPLPSFEHLFVFILCDGTETMLKGGRHSADVLLSRGLVRYSFWPQSMFSSIPWPCVTYVHSTR